MSQGTIPIKKAVLIIVLTWILSLVTTLALVYVAPTIFPLVCTANVSNGAVTAPKIADGAIVTTKLADGSVTSEKILDGTVTAVDLSTGAITAIKIVDGAVNSSKIADYAVTNLKLAPYAIPINFTFSDSSDTTNSTNWVDMRNMSLTLTLDRTSHVLIMFSTEAKNDDPSGLIVVRALVNETVAYPPMVYLTPSVAESAGHRHALYFGAYSYNFYKPSVSAGTYTIKIQWKVTVGLATVWHRTLTIIALPA